jgi:hypothetical protein
MLSSIIILKKKRKKKLNANAVSCFRILNYKNHKQFTNLEAKEDKKNQTKMLP